jgi:hypothetical protein
MFQVLLGSVPGTLPSPVSLRLEALTSINVIGPGVSILEIEMPNQATVAAYPLTLPLPIASNFVLRIAMRSMEIRLVWFLARLVTVTRSH